MKDVYGISGAVYPAKTARLELIELVREVMSAGYQTGDRVSIPRTIMDRVVADLEHAVQLLDALGNERDKNAMADFASRKLWPNPDGSRKDYD